jgi:hypothetical protein
VGFDPGAPPAPRSFPGLVYRERDLVIRTMRGYL